MRLSPPVIAALLVVAQVMVEPALARACSCIPSAIWNSDPPDGTSDFPLNQALVVQGRLKAESVRLEDVNGAAVEFDLDQGPTPACPGTWAELVPKKPLAPMTQYRIRVESSAPLAIDPDRTSLTFTTGTRLLPEQNLRTPTGRASVVEGLPQSGVACGPTTVQACVGLDDYTNVEMVARRGDEIIMRWLFSDDTTDANFGFGVVPDCLEFRRRAATGQRSAPLTICGDALGTRSARADETSSQFVQCRAGVIGVPEPDASDAARPTQDEDEDADVSASQSEATEATPKLSSDGCSASAPGQGAGVAAAMLLLLAAARRRTSRRDASRAS
jgi:hypothetical protein